MRIQTNLAVILCPGIAAGPIVMMALISKKALIISVQIIMWAGQIYTIGQAIQLQQIPAVCIPYVYALLPLKVTAGYNYIIIMNPLLVK